jgi:hypothetical protein
MVHDRARDTQKEFAENGTPGDTIKMEEKIVERRATARGGKAVAEKTMVGVA